MSDVPETRYAKTPDGLRIAYQVIGDAPLDIVLMGGAMSASLAFKWDQPLLARALGRLASFARLIVLDPRGFGASDMAPGALEDVLVDTTTVMDAVESDRAAIVGLGFDGLTAILFAATHPERTGSLVLFNAFARFLRDDDYPWGIPQRLVDATDDQLVSDWGTGEQALQLAPSMAGDEDFRLWAARGELAGQPRNLQVAFLRDYMARDVRAVLPVVRVPTLVLHRRDDNYIRIGHGRYLADHIPSAKYVELPGRDHYWFTENQDALIDEIEEFLTGARPRVQVDRVLSTILFTDIVNSTPKQAELGDAQWHQLLDRHDNVVRRELDRHLGTRIKSTGDGVLARFDGPARAIRCTQAIVSGLVRLGLDVRAGIHTGEIELRGDDVTGLAVTIGRRVSDLAGPGEVLVSSTVKDLVAGSGIVFADRGMHALKGIEEQWRLFAVQP